MRTSQPIQSAPKLYLQYDIIEELKTTCANISMYDLPQIYPMPNSPIINPAMSSIIPNVKKNIVANNSNIDLTLTDKGKSAAGFTNREKIKIYNPYVPSYLQDF